MNPDQPTWRWNPGPRTFIDSQYLICLILASSNKIEIIANQKRSQLNDIINTLNNLLNIIIIITIAKRLHRHHHPVRPCSSVEAVTVT